MNTRFLTLLITLTVLCGTCAAQQWPEPAGRMEVRNRVLATVNGEPITALDLAERLDLMFAEGYPEYAKQPMARYEFFNVNWQVLLKELVNDALVRADANEKKIPVTNADVRQEIEDRFGPNVLETLDAAGLTYERAFELIRNDILVRRMSGFRIHNKAYVRVHPTLVKETYKEYVDGLTSKMSWRYCTVTFRADDTARAQAEAARVHEFLAKTGATMDNLSLDALTQAQGDPSVDIAISEEFVRNESDISPIHRSVIETMQSNTVSQPVVQEGRSGPVTRIYVVAEVKRPEVLAFTDAFVKVRDELLSRYIGEEAKTYFTYLRRHFDVEEKIGDQSPFVWVQ